MSRYCIPTHNRTCGTAGHTGARRRKSSDSRIPIRHCRYKCRTDQGLCLHRGTQTLPAPLQTQSFPSNCRRSSPGSHSGEHSVRCQPQVPFSLRLQAPIPAVVPSQHSRSGIWGRGPHSSSEHSTGRHSSSVQRHAPSSVHTQELHPSSA